MSRLGQVGHRLYTGELSIDFVGRRKLWYAISVVILVIAVLAVIFRGLNFGIEFRGGAEFRVPAPQCSVEEARHAVGALTEAEPVVQALGNGDLRVQTEALDAGEPDQVRGILADTCNVVASDISTQLIGPSWGEEITNKAVVALIVFLVLVVGFIWIAFERKMAIAAIVALLHDIVITVGLYALVGFDVTPSTLIGMLTILGYSLYDTVVVFDSIRENTRGITAGNQMTYSEAANLSVNQTLVRSINTSVIALLPVTAILFFGAYALGAGTLKDLSLVLFVGIAASTYSSIFIATPLLADLKEREPAMKALRRRVELRRAAAEAKTAVKPAAASTQEARAEGAVATATIVDPTERRQPQRTTRAQRRPGQGKKRR